MKKTIFFGIAVLFALVMVSCDFGPAIAEKAGVPQYTADGRRLVELTVDTGGTDRALTQALAQAGVDFFEVTFHDTNGSNDAVYRSSWDFAQTGRVLVPEGTYNNTTGTNTSLLFAGRQSDKTLLAIGIATAIDGTPPSGDYKIETNTKTVSFTLVGLTTDVHGKAQGSSASTFSSFLITQANYITSTNYETKVLPTAKFSDKNIPIFEIPNTGTATASYKIGIPGTTGTNFTNPFANYTGLKLRSAIRFFNAGVSVAGNVLSPVKLPTIAATAPLYNANPLVSFPAGGEIQITFTAPTSAQNGLSKFALEIPVFAINGTNSPIEWVIRGGLQNSSFDEGTAPASPGPGDKDSIGGTILLGVGNIKVSDLIELEILHGWFTP